MPTQTLASSHRPTCSTAAAHAHSTSAHAHTGPRCSHSAHGQKGKPGAHHTSGHHAKHHPVKKKAAPKHAPTTVPASCEDGSSPVRAAGGSFSCKDDSRPDCEDGSTPTRSDAGLRCPAPSQAEDPEDEEESECEEGVGLSCDPDGAPGSSEQACLPAPGLRFSFVCDDAS